MLSTGHGLCAVYVAHLLSNNQTLYIDRVARPDHVIQLLTGSHIHDDVCRAKRQDITDRETAGRRSPIKTRICGVPIVKNCLEVPGSIETTWRSPNKLRLDGKQVHDLYVCQTQRSGLSVLCLLVANGSCKLGWPLTKCNDLLHG